MRANDSEWMSLLSSVRESPKIRILSYVTLRIASADGSPSLSTAISSLLVVLGDYQAGDGVKKML